MSSSRATARIRYRPVEKMLRLDAGVRGFDLTAARGLKVTDQLEILNQHWAAMEQAVTARPGGPWMISVTRSGLRQLLPAID